MSRERSFSWSCCGSVTTRLSVIVNDSGLHKPGRVSIPLQSMLHSPDVRPIARRALVSNRPFLSVKQAVPFDVVEDHARGRPADRVVPGRTARLEHDPLSLWSKTGTPAENDEYKDGERKKACLGSPSNLRPSDWKFFARWTRR